MTVLKTIIVKLTDGKTKELVIGRPDADSELDGMYRFRNDQYVKRGYIKKGFYPDGRDYDEYDRENKCVYFIAQIDDRLLGTARLIMDEYLPTEKECFRFKEPAIMLKIPRDKRAEIGRLIASKYSEDVFLPRHTVMLGLFLCIFDYCRDNGILGGYGFIKDKLKKKLAMIKAPFHVIKEHEQIYQGKVLHNYFNDPNDRVWPIYFELEEARRYFSLLNKINFKKVGDQRYKLRKFIR